VPASRVDDWRRAALVALLVATACTRSADEPAAAPAARPVLEARRLVQAPPGTLLPTYTLADETRPVLGGIHGVPVALLLPADVGERFTFPLPAELGAGEVIATGAYSRAKRNYPFPPQLLAVSPPDASGARTATLAVPPLARGFGPPTQTSLLLTPPPAGDVVEARSAPVAVPADAELQLAYALTEAVGFPGAAPVSLEVAAAADRSEQLLWSITLEPQAAGAQHWTEVAIPLAALAGREVRFVFRARRAGEGRPALFPLWGDPTITAPGTRPPVQRNVVIISLDTLRADRIGVYGSYRPTTPAIDALAAESVIFDATWSAWPETSGSHMSLFTSRFPSEHGVTSFIFRPAPSIELLAERLRREGWLTRAFTEDGGVWANAGFARGFSAYSERRSPDSVNRGEAAATFADATRWVEAHADRSFFLFVHTYQVHGPYTPPKTYRGLFADVPGREPFGQTVNALNYDREVRFTDDQVGPFLAKLRALGLAERTIVLVLSDHGEEFGEHGGMGHGRTLYREVLQVPLIVWAPGLLPPHRVAGDTSLLDVAPTLLDLLGLAPDSAQRGVSLAAAARGAASAPAARPIFGELDRADQIYHDELHFVSVRRDGRTAIKDLRDGSLRCYASEDRAEQRPTADCADLEALMTEHRQAIAPAVAQPVPTSDPRLIEKMRALGYVQ
jgi:arylsulfatase A-like enzyme